MAANTKCLARNNKFRTWAETTKRRMSQRGHRDMGVSTMSAKPLTTVELEVIRRLFLRGLTWDRDLFSRDCCTSLRDRGLAQYEFGFAWLTPEGMEIAIQELGLPCAEHMEAAE
jgi:hypothetical protein